LATITEQAVRDLAGFRTEDVPVVSCYLDVDGRRHVRPADYEHQLEQLLRTVRNQSGSVRADPEDLDRIVRFVQDGIDRSRVRGLAMFSCLSAGLFEVLELPVSVRDQVLVGHAPAVNQLELVLQHAEPVGVLLVDKEHSRVFVFELGELVERSELLEELPRDYDSRGQLARGDVDHHVDDLTSQHVRHATQAAFAMYQDHPFAHLVVGAAPELRSQVESALHPYLRERLGPDLTVRPSAALDEVRAAAIEAEVAIESERERELVERLRSTAQSGGRAVTGLGSVLEASSQRRVSHLVVSAGYVEPGWRCGTCGRLATVGPACPACEATMSAEDNVVAEAVDAAIVASSQVDVCLDNADLDVLGRIGAFLRY
jgi:peptide chain release factor subunit 1